MRLWLVCHFMHTEQIREFAGNADAAVQANTDDMDKYIDDLTGSMSTTETTRRHPAHERVSRTQQSPEKFAWRKSGTKEQKNFSPTGNQGFPLRSRAPGND